MKKGMAIGLIFFVLIVLFLGGMTISYLMHGVQRQLEFSDAHIRAQYIAESAMNLLLAKLLSKPWEERWFANSSDAAIGVVYGGGNYDYFIKDSPGRPRHADIWVRASYKNTKRFFFWRVKYQQDLLNGFANSSPVSSTELAQEQFPSHASKIDHFTAQVEELIRKRRENDVAATAIGKELESITNPGTAISGIGGEIPSTIKTDGFSEKGEKISLPPPPTPVNIPVPNVVPNFFPHMFSNIPNIFAIRKGMENFVEKEEKFEDTRRELDSFLKHLGKEMFKIGRKVKKGMPVDLPGPVKH